MIRVFSDPIASGWFDQTTSVPRPVTVRRFAPRVVGISLRPSRDRSAP